MTALRATVIIDYQNVYSGTKLFDSQMVKIPRIVHPLHYGNEIIKIRNQKQSMATLVKVLVYRGLPSSEYEPRKYAHNQSQKSEWEKSPLVKVTMRPLKYDFQRDTQGKLILDRLSKKIVMWPPQEKGIDVHCALALILETLNPKVDLVILCTQDTDLVPALDEALKLKAAKVETASWEGSKLIRPTHPGHVWNTTLNANSFIASLDTKVYF